MNAPKRIGLVSNGLGGWRLWSTDDLDTGGCDYPDAEYILAAEHDRLMAEKDARIAELERQRLRVDRRIRQQRVQLAWWNKMFSERLGSACRRRIYYPRWIPILHRRAKARAALNGDDNG